MSDESAQHDAAAGDATGVKRPRSEEEECGGDVTISAKQVRTTRSGRHVKPVERFTYDSLDDVIVGKQGDAMADPEDLLCEGDSADDDVLDSDDSLNEFVADDDDEIEYVDAEISIDDEEEEDDDDEEDNEDEEDETFDASSSSSSNTLQLPDEQEEQATEAAPAAPTTDISDP